MRRWIRPAFIGLVVAFAAIQIVRPARTNPVTDPARTIHRALGPDAAAVKTIDRSCRDCHTRDTVWPWYSEVAPVSWLVVHDVNEGREAVNFSDWAGYAPDRRQKLLAEACAEVSDGDMPGLPYTLVHREARLTKADVDAICALQARKPAAGE